MGLRAPALVARAALLVAAAAALGCPPVRRDKPVSHVLDDEPRVRELVRQLEAPLASQRARAAFALGQLREEGQPPPIVVEAEHRLDARLTRERDDAVRAEIAAALGRVGAMTARHALIAELARPGAARRRAGWALACVYRRMREGRSAVDLGPDLEQLRLLLIAPEADVRAAITDAIAEMQIQEARPVLARELGDADPLTRARAARGMIALARVEDLGALVPLLDDEDERAAAAAAQALAALGERGEAAAIAVLKEKVASLARPAVVQALAAQALRRAELAPVFAALDRLLEPGEGLLACAAAFAHDRARARIELVPTCGGARVDDAHHRRLVAEVLGACDPALTLGAVDTLLALRGDDDPAVRCAIAGALARYDDPRARHRVLALIDDADGRVQACAAEAAASRGWREAGPHVLRALPPRAPDGAPMAPDDVDRVLSLLGALAVLRPDDAAARVRAYASGTPRAVAVAAGEVMSKLGDPVVLHPATIHGPYDELALPSAAPRVRLETDRGAIVIELDPVHAPKNARNFLGLVQRGFYDGLTFHRVVPGFVAQGGDPRGDGSGGADHLVACEPNPLPYVEGTVGMALSGRDTGSSQFFITLAPAPHLEGRYTAFGRVVEGMGVARALRVDDRIRSARLLGP